MECRFVGKIEWLTTGIYDLFKFIQNHIKLYARKYEERDESISIHSIGYWVSNVELLNVKPSFCFCVKWIGGLGVCLGFFVSDSDPLVLLTSGMLPPNVDYLHTLNTFLFRFRLWVICSFRYSSIEVDLCQFPIHIRMSSRKC